ncbi:ABC transporter permease [Leucobacter sp. UT-8R-CII-1-4]|uniref:ABC transporter permease n=1 Tax=Leucobacter sp. UT-8R-CII-1-4 TaxID=3040075 RepID=UPI0024A8A1C8|nr:ABC transporter permease [Leucobacter sp. UT-8R-CII-1-4]MDI6024352.1 ABC transporter permease [Leucobacter sp. UT-8R-CII-1-4]
MSHNDHRLEVESTWSRFAAGLVGTFGEAWGELRTHKLRVILSLIGIAVAVAALTAVVGLGELQKQATLENSERWGGRIATLRIDTFTEDGTPVDWGAADERFAAVNERYGFTHTTRLIDGQVQVPVQLPEGVTMVASQQIDPAYPIIHRAKLQEGRWFTARDAELLAPPVVVSAPMWERLGSPPLSSHPTLTMTDAYAGTYQIIGVLPKAGEWDQELRVSMLFDSYIQRVGAVPKEVPVVREVWVSGKKASEIGPVLAMDLRAGLPTGVKVSVSRTDSGASPDFEQSFMMMQIITSAISSIVLLLGGLSLVNIQLVAMRQRIREIGVRRSFGASSGRIFASVMMESVVATAVAGVLGIILAVAVVRSPLIMNNLFYGMQDVPPFPILAALIGLAAAVLTGALAGLVPAIVATKVRVIDAIRY